MLLTSQAAMVTTLLGGGLKWAQAGVTGTIQVILSGTCGLAWHKPAWSSKWQRHVCNFRHRND